MSEAEKIHKVLYRMFAWRFCDSFEYLAWYYSSVIAQVHTLL